MCLFWPLLVASLAFWWLTVVGLGINSREIVGEARKYLGYWTRYLSISTQGVVAPGGASGHPAAIEAKILGSQTLGRRIRILLPNRAVSRKRTPAFVTNASGWARTAPNASAGGLGYVRECVPMRPGPIAGLARMSPACPVGHRWHFFGGHSELAATVAVITVDRVSG